MPFKLNLAESRTLCGTCHNGHVVVRANDDITVYCDKLMYNSTVPPDIKQCTAYEDKRMAQKYELEKIAWVLNSDKKGGPAGFHPPKKRNEDD